MSSPWHLTHLRGDDRLLQNWYRRYDVDATSSCAYICAVRHHARYTYTLLSGGGTCTCGREQCSRVDANTDDSCWNRLQHGRDTPKHCYRYVRSTLGRVITVSACLVFLEFFPSNIIPNPPRFPRLIRNREQSIPTPRSSIIYRESRVLRLYGNSTLCTYVRWPI